MDTIARSPSLRRQLVTFAAVGVLSTLAYGLLYLLFREVASAQASNTAALLLTAVGNTAANRRFTFGVRGSGSELRDQVAGLAAFGIALAMTNATVAALRFVVPAAGHLLELGVLVVANVASTASRFVLLRSWIGRGARAASPLVVSERTLP